jgi:hypothetical protein
MTPENAQKLDKLTDKFLNNEITLAQFEYCSSCIPGATQRIDSTPQNSGPRSDKNSTGFKGVILEKGRFKAQCIIQLCHDHHLGRFGIPEQAAQALSTDKGKQRKEAFQPIQEIKHPSQQQLVDNNQALNWQLVERKEAVEQPQPATTFEDVGVLLDDAAVARQVHAELNSRQGRRAASFAARAKVCQGLRFHRAFGGGSEAPVQERRKSRECRQKEHDKIVEQVRSYSDNQLVAALRAGGHGSDIPKGSTVRQRQREAETVVLRLSLPLPSLGTTGERVVCLPAFGCA